MIQLWQRWRCSVAAITAQAAAQSVELSCRTFLHCHNKHVLSEAPPSSAQSSRFLTPDAPVTSPSLLPPSQVQEERDKSHVCRCVALTHGSREQRCMTECKLFPCVSVVTWISKLYCLQQLLTFIYSQQQQQQQSKSLVSEASSGRLLCCVCMNLCVSHRRCVCAQTLALQVHLWNLYKAEDNVRVINHRP